uniref:Uncharacterized protein n=1 Tax=Anguilla anguilla TaxID=7936 RepID=A0A0E9PV07_ANGAN
MSYMTSHQWNTQYCISAPLPVAFCG